MKYLAFLNNYDIRPCTAQYLWWFFYVMDHVPHTYFVLNSDYLSFDKSRWEYAKYESAPYKYSNPAGLYPSKYKVIEKFENLPELKDVVIPSKILNYAMHTPVPTLVQEISSIIEKEGITASISWCNNASVEEACRKHNIPAIHNESGALRTPFFIDTCYFDFSGVNGNTEFYSRFLNFKKIADRVKIFPREELLQIISQPAHREYITNLSKAIPTCECGVAMQVDVDTNVLAFNDGVTEADVVRMAAKDHNRSLLVRNHPLSSIGYIKPASLGLGKVDDSKNSLEFVSKCAEIYTLNSSVGLEAMLLGRKATILGSNPFKELQYMNEEDLILALNFAVFSYLMPTTRLYNEEYYKMRIEVKDEEALYNEGQAYWLKECCK